MPLIFDTMDSMKILYKERMPLPENYHLLPLVAIPGWNACRRDNTTININASRTRHIFDKSMKRAFQKIDNYADFELYSF